MHRPKIKTSLIGSLSLMTIVIAALSWFSVTSLQTLNRNTADIADNWMPSVAAVKQIEGALDAENLAFAKHVLSVNKEQMAAAGDGVNGALQNRVSALKGYEPFVSSSVEDETLKELAKTFDAYEAFGKEMVELSADNDKEFAKALFDGDMKTSAAQVHVLIAKLLAVNEYGAAAAKAESQATYKLVILQIYAIIAVAAVVIIGTVLFALRGIAAPIQIITRSTTRLADGDVETAIPYAGRRDEIGELAGAVEIFRKAAIANRELEQGAIAERRKAETDRIRVTQEAEAAAQTRLLQATSGLASGLKRLAAGDLSFQLNEPFAPDFEALRHDLNIAVAQLADTMRAVSHTAGQIDTGTREISQSADDLSKRTEQQAASLEQTAAALDQITVNVTNSSRRTEEARTVAGQANSSAAQSGAVVANAVDAMRRIEESSSQISNIIGVIDEIAFQTNLLALNAGVEAARAGDAGKGFAVVAQEVRELAQRSAKAAKEIKELIRNSTAEVEGGVKLVRDTGEALKTIETYIITINQHMDAIATSAREQSTGLSEVNTAVNQMDQVTQQNAAMVEETNAASFGLATESGKLRELIAQFQLAGAEAGYQSHGRSRAA